MDQLQKHTTTDSLDNILKQFEKPALTNNTYTLKMDHVQITEHMGTKPKQLRDITQINREVSKEQVISDKRVPLNRDSEKKSKESDSQVRTRYGRIRRKPYMFAY